MKTHEDATNAAEKAGLVSLIVPSETDRAAFDESLSIQKLLSALTDEGDQKPQQNANLIQEREFFEQKTAFYGFVDEQYRDVEFIHCSSLLEKKLSHTILMFDQYGSYFIAMAWYTDDMQNIVDYSDLSDLTPAGSYVITNDGKSEFLLLPSDGYDEYYEIEEGDRRIKLVKLNQKRDLNDIEFGRFLVQQKGIEKGSWTFKACKL